MKPSAIQVWEVIGIWFAGLATVSAVALALYLRHIYERRQRPKLFVVYDREQKSDNRYVLPPFAATSSCQKGQKLPDQEELWVRVHVQNASKATAKDVELRLISIQREKKGSADDRPSWWFKASNLNATSLVIPPKFTQHFDIAYVKNTVESSADLSFYLAIVPPDLLPWPQEKTRIESDEQNNRLDIGWKYKLLLALVSSNADAKHFQMEIKVDPPGSEDPSIVGLLGEEVLRKRVNVISFSEVEI